MIRRQSFISNLFGDNTYEYLRSIAFQVFPIGAVVLLILYVLAHFFHSDVINYFLNLTNGLSLLFIGYVVVAIVFFDIQVDVEEPDRVFLRKEKKEAHKPFKYKLTIVWGLFLLILGIAAIYYSNRYRNHYDFECESFLVDEKAGIYHLDWETECVETVDTEYIKKMKGYQLDPSFKFCEDCQIVLEDMESEGMTVHARP